MLTRASAETEPPGPTPTLSVSIAYTSQFIFENELFYSLCDNMFRQRPSLYYQNPPYFGFITFARNPLQFNVYNELAQ